MTQIVDSGSHGQNHEQATGLTHTSTFYHRWLPMAPHKLPIVCVDVVCVDVVVLMWRTSLMMSHPPRNTHWAGHHLHMR